MTVTAMDGDGESVMQAFIVTVAAASRACNPNPDDHAGDGGHADPHADARADIKSRVAGKPRADVRARGHGDASAGRGRGFPVGLILVLLLVAGGGAAAFIIRRRGSTGPPAQPI